ncbi:hypothetical protein L204_105589 [Cryptococcus depauperatus]
MSECFMGIDKIPKLVGIRNYHEWKLAVENYLLVRGCIGIIEGTDVEPFRQLITTSNVPIPRSVRAGSAVPTPTETIGGEELDYRDEDKWANWRNREQIAQGVICSTIDEEMLLNIRPMKSALEMWTFLKTDMRIETREHQLKIERKIRNLRL